MRVAFGVDEPNAVSDRLPAWLAEQGHEVDVVAIDVPWPDAGRAVGSAVAEGRVDVGVVCCWTGTGVAIAANKVPGVRAALCTDAETARGARRWNDANVVALGLRLTTEALAGEILDAFLATPVDADEVDTIARLDEHPDENLGDRPG